MAWEPTSSYVACFSCFVPRGSSVDASHSAARCEVHVRKRQLFFLFLITILSSLVSCLLLMAYIQYLPTYLDTLFDLVGRPMSRLVGNRPKISTDHGTRFGHCYLTPEN